jgi:hypothetical protein
MPVVLFSTQLFQLSEKGSAISKAVLEALQLQVHVEPSSSLRLLLWKLIGEAARSPFLSSTSSWETLLGG